MFALTEKESIGRLWNNLRQSTPSNTTYTPTVPLTARPNTTPLQQHGNYVPLTTRSVSQGLVNPVLIEEKRRRLIDIIGEKNVALEHAASQTPMAERRAQRGQFAFQDLDSWVANSDRRARRSKEGRLRWVWCRDGVSGSALVINTFICL